MAGNSTVTNQDAINAQSIVFKELCSSLFANRSPGIGENIALIETATAKTIKALGMGSLGVMRQWEGEKQVKGQRAFNFEYTMVPFEGTKEFDAFDMRYDVSGEISRYMSNWLSQIARSHIDRLVFSVINSNPVGYDKVPLFDSAHPFAANGGTQSNKTSSALGFGSYDAARQAFQTWTDEDGEAFDTFPNLLIVGPSQEKIAKEITGSKDLVKSISNAGVLEATSNVVGGATMTNVFAGGDTNVLVTRRFVGANAGKWILCDTANPECRLVRVYTGRNPEAVVQNAPESESRFLRNKVRASVESDHAYGPGIWASGYGGGM